MNQYDPMTSGHYGEEESEARVPRSRRRGAARPRHIAGAEPSGMNHERGPVSGDHGYEKVRPQETPKKKHPFRTLFLLLLLAALAGAGWLGFKIFAGGAGNTAQAGYYTVAVFGLDSRNGNVSKEALSDVNVIARFDMESGEIRLVSLYRDTYSQISADGSFHNNGVGSHVHAGNTPGLADDDHPADLHVAFEGPFDAHTARTAQTAPPVDAGSQYGGDPFNGGRSGLPRCVGVVIVVILPSEHDLPTFSLSDPDT